MTTDNIDIGSVQLRLAGHAYELTEDNDHSLSNVLSHAVGIAHIPRGEFNAINEDKAYYKDDTVALVPEDYPPIPEPDNHEQTKAHRVHYSIIEMTASIDADTGYVLVPEDYTDI